MILPTELFMDFSTLSLHVHYHYWNSSCLHPSLSTGFHYLPGNIQAPENMTTSLCIIPINWLQYWHCLDSTAPSEFFQITPFLFSASLKTPSCPDGTLWLSFHLQDNCWRILKLKHEETKHRCISVSNFEYLDLLSGNHFVILFMRPVDR